MPIPFLATALAGLLGGLGSGVAAGQTASANRQSAASAAARRRQLLDLIERVNEQGSQAGVREAASQQFSAASDQVQANAASRGMSRAGNAGPGAAQQQVLAQILTGLAAQEMQRRQAAQQMEAQLLSDPSFGVPNPETLMDPGLAGLLGFLGGGAGAAGGTLANFLGTDAGIAMLAGGDNPMTRAATPNDYSDWLSALSNVGRTAGGPNG